MGGRSCLDVKDLGVHMDTVLRGWSACCQGSVGFLPSGSCFCLPLDFHGGVNVVHFMFNPAALHGVEASLLASDGLRKLMSSTIRLCGPDINCWLVLMRSSASWMDLLNHTACCVVLVQVSFVLEVSCSLVN